jgi:2-oxo-4-hydroxy-4-carboxy-5-ureidoimidazoline decarboxylase
MIEDVLTEPGLRQCCAADAWVSRLLAGRPYPSAEALEAASDAATSSLDDAGLAQALGGHPRIGKRVHGGWSAQEQAGVGDADADARAQLAEANADSERRFGHVYLVCASGRSADELLAICRSRLANDPETERGVVLDELAKINRLRLRKLLEETP